MTDQLKNDIIHWVGAGCDFRAGLALYVKAVGKGHATIYVLRNYSPSNHQALATALCFRAGIPIPSIDPHKRPVPKAGGKPSVPEPVKAPTRKIRDDYTFLSEPGTPPELKVLVSNKITAYHAFKAAHAKLFDSTTPDEDFANVRTLVENYIDNFAIHQELAHYQKTKTILGKHPIFEEMKRLKTYRNSSTLQLIKQAQRVKHNIWRIRKLIESGDKPHLRFDREQKLKAYELELAELEKFIGE